MRYLRKNNEYNRRLQNILIELISSYTDDERKVYTQSMILGFPLFFQVTRKTCIEEMPWRNAAKRKSLKDNLNALKTMTTGNPIPIEVRCAKTSKIGDALMQIKLILISSKVFYSAYF